MNTVERGKAFLASLQALAGRSGWEWKPCPYCGSQLTIKNGSYARHPWSLEGRETVRVQRHLCRECHRTYAEESALWVRGSWYSRGVRRAAIDHWQHQGSSLRRVAEALRSLLGHQERWRTWRPLDTTSRERCYLCASTVHRWLDGAGQRAAESVPDQLTGIGDPQVLGTDGLWAKLKGQVVRVVLLTVDSVSGLIYTPVVAKGAESAAPWRRAFGRAREAGLNLQTLRGATSDGAIGLLAYLRRELGWVQQQRCVWHLWRNLGAELSRATSQAVQALSGEAAKQVRQQVRAELCALIRRIVDAQSADQAETALVELLAHPQGWAIGKFLTNLLDRLLVDQMDYCRGLQRVSPEWYWRDFRLRLTVAIIAQSSVWNGRRYSGRSTTTSSPLNGDQNANVIIVTPGRAHSKWQVCPPDRSVTWMLWASICPQNRRSWSATNYTRGRAYLLYAAALVAHQHSPGIANTLPIRVAKHKFATKTWYDGIANIIVRCTSTRAGG